MKVEKTSFFGTIFLFATFMILIGSSYANSNISYSQQEEETKQQIIIKDNIKSYDSYGLEYKSDYVSTFTPAKAFDNMLITPQVKNTGFSQLGNSGFTVNLQTPLDKDKPVCSAEIYVLNPKNTAFLLTVGNKSFEGKLDATMIPVNFAPNCAFDVSQIKLDIKSPNNLYNPIEEIKLFTQKQDPPIEPPVCPPNSYWDSKLKKCVAINPPIGNNTAIVNSTIALTVSNSTITIDADEGSEIITILGDAKDNNNNEDEQDENNVAKDVEEEEQEQDKDKDDKKDKDQKDDKN